MAGELQTPAADVHGGHLGGQLGIPLQLHLVIDLGRAEEPVFQDPEVPLESPAGQRWEGEQGARERPAGSGAKGMVHLALPTSALEASDLHLTSVLNHANQLQMPISSRKALNYLEIL